jgi:hypothetical protein
MSPRLTYAILRPVRFQAGLVPLATRVSPVPKAFIVQMEARPPVSWTKAICPGGLCAGAGEPELAASIEPTTAAATGNIPRTART